METPRHFRPIIPRRDLIALAFCVAFGLLISLLPHFIWWQKTGDTAWIASYDELVCYYPVAAQSYFNHPWRIADPTFAEGGVSMFPWLQYAPFVLLAKLFHTGPLFIGVFWRAWAGASMALGLFLVARHFLKHTRAAALVACVMMADAGVNWGRPLFNQFTVAWGLLQETPPEWFFGSHPVLLLQWRLITPGLSLFFLLLHVWLVARAAAQPSRGNLALAGAGFGLLFYVYFYFWTAAGLALLLALALDARRRKIYLHTGWIGGVIGLPSLILNTLLKQGAGNDWLERTDKFVAIPHFSELLISKVAIAMLVVAFVWIWLRRREWIHLWTLPAAGLLLMNHQVLTGLQIENGHWGYVLFMGLSLLVLIAIADALAKALAGRVEWRWTLGFVCALHLAAGVWFRAEEATQSRQMLEIQTNLERYADQRELAAPIAFTPNSVIAGDAPFVDFAAVLDNLRPLERTAFLSSSVSAENWDMRIALNAFLNGATRDAFEQEQRALLNSNHTGSWGRDPVKRDLRLARRLAAFDTIPIDPARIFDHFAVRYVALPASQARPAYLAGGWILLQSGPHWHVWERR
ncbi:MAG: hypothetical protein AB1705_08280 [Verrucomicrobiota bacterium]